jgi:NTE family protein
MKADAVFQGGGMRGIGIIGALTYLEKQGYVWQRVAGTSVGSVIASCLAAGYSAKELRKIILYTDYTKFMDKSGVQRIPIIGKAFGLFKEKALYSGDYMEDWIAGLLKAKGVEKFKDICTEGQSRLKIIASDITRKKLLVLPDDLADYGFDPMEFKISAAVRMSSSIPFYFKPVKLDYSEGTSFIVDGSVTLNYPINIFDVEGTPRWPTLGFMFKNDRVSFTSEGRTDPVSFMYDIAGTLSYDREKRTKSQENLARSIVIPTVGVDSTEFNISRERNLELYKSGYRSAEDFIKRWDFEAYVEKYRSDHQSA